MLLFNWLKIERKLNFRTFNLKFNPILFTQVQPTIFNSDYRGISNKYKQRLATLNFKILYLSFNQWTFWWLLCIQSKLPLLIKTIYWYIERFHRFDILYDREVLEGPNFLKKLKELRVVSILLSKFNFSVKSIYQFLTLLFPSKDNSCRYVRQLSQDTIWKVDKKIKKRVIFLLYWTLENGLNICHELKARTP